MSAIGDVAIRRERAHQLLDKAFELIDDALGPFAGDLPRDVVMRLEKHAVCCGLRLALPEDA